MNILFKQYQINNENNIFICVAFSFDMICCAILPDPNNFCASNKSLLKVIGSEKERPSGSALNFAVMMVVMGGGDGL